jgi:LysM repeat protein
MSELNVFPVANCRYQALGPRESGQGIILGSEAAPYSGSRNALGNQAGSGLHTYTRGSDRKPNQIANSSFNPYMSLEDLAPNAMEKIEALAMEGLKIQSEMTENDAPYSVDALSWEQEREAINGGGGGGGGFKVKQGGEGIGMLEGASALHLLEGGHSAVGTASDIFNNDLMSTAISLDEWMRLDAGICDEETSKSSLATVAAHNALHQNMIVMEKDEDSGKTCNRNKGGVLGINTLTLAMLIQLHDPLRDYEPVGAPMMALVQAERVMVPSSPRAKLGRCISEKGNSEEDEHSSVSPAPQQQQQQFKIVDITVSGLKIDDNSTTTTGGEREVGWGNQRQKQSGSRWLVANGMSKSLKHKVLKTKAPPPPPPSLPATPAKFKVQKGETLWSISSLIHGTGAKWQEVAALNPHIRNPDVIFANTTIRTR